MNDKPVVSCFEFLLQIWTQDQGLMTYDFHKETHPTDQQTCPKSNEIDYILASLCVIV